MMGTFSFILFLFTTAAGLRGKPLPNVGFAFRGYHLLHGNPLATQVTSDPGFAGQIFRADYSSEEVSADLQYSVPAGIKMFNKDGCSQAFSSDVIETSEEYVNLLKNIVKTNYTGFDNSFKGSKDYQHVHKKTTQNSDSKFLMTQMLCVSYEVVLDSYNPPDLTQNFRDGALQIMSAPKDNASEIRLRIHRFLTAFGTHYIKKLDMGSRYTYQNHLTTEMRQALLENDINPSTGAILSVSRKLGQSLTEKELIESKLFEKISIKGAKSSSYVGGGTGGSVELAKKNPIPLFYEIERIDTLFVKKFMKKANLHYKLIKARLGEYFNNYCGNEKKITGTDPCIVDGESLEMERKSSKNNFKIILPVLLEDVTPSYLTWRHKIQTLKAVTVSWWMKTPPYVSNVNPAQRRTILSYSNTGKLNLFKIEVNPETAGGSIGVWLGEKKITKDCHPCPIPVDDHFHHYVFTWSNLYGRWQVYIDGNVIEGGTDNRNYKVPQGGYIVIGQDQITNRPSDSSFQGEIAFLNLWDMSLNGVEARRLSTRTDLHGNVVAWSQADWKFTGDSYDREIVLNDNEYYRI